MSGNTQESLRSSQARSIIAAFNVPSWSTASEFLEPKIGDVDGGLEDLAQYRHGLKEVFASRILDSRDYDAESESLEENTMALQREKVTIKRQRKSLKEDLEEKPSSKQPEETYAASIMQRGLAATAKQPNQFHKMILNGEHRRLMKKS
ncbi:hypothetical protein MMC29_007156 [Sticta canariensis]|nr:hypothetical protein [Sticta canariensis]